MRGLGHYVAVVMIACCPAFCPGQEFRVVHGCGTVQESCDGFRGSFATLPVGMSVSADGANALTNGSADFLDVHAGGARTGGCYAWQVTATNYAIGSQPTTDKFTPGFIQWVLQYQSTEPAESMHIGYEVVYRNDADRSTVTRCLVARNDGAFSELAVARFETPLGAELSATWSRAIRQGALRFSPPLVSGERLTIRWLSDDAGGSGSRDEIGIDSPSMTLRPLSGTVVSIR